MRYRKLIVKVALKEAATKNDIDKLKNGIKDVENRLSDVKVEGLRKEMKSLEMKLDKKL